MIITDIITDQWPYANVLLLDVLNYVIVPIMWVEYYYYFYFQVREMNQREIKEVSPGHIFRKR